MMARCVVTEFWNSKVKSFFLGRGKETRQTAMAVIQLRGDGSPEHTVAVRPWTLF